MDDAPMTENEFVNDAAWRWDKKTVSWKRDRINGGNFEIGRNSSGWYQCKVTVGGEFIRPPFKEKDESKRDAWRFYLERRHEIYEQTEGDIGHSF